MPSDKSVFDQRLNHYRSRKLATNGTVLSVDSFRALKSCYFRIALDLIDSYHNDALYNGLTLDRHAEEEAVELFSKNIIQAGETFLANPMETPFIPNGTG